MTPISTIIDETRADNMVMSTELGKVLQINTLDLTNLNSALQIAQAQKTAAQAVIDKLTPFILQLQALNPPIIP